jgi:hypothetical protein
MAFARAEMLARREGATGYAIDEQLNPARHAMGEAHMIGGPPVAEGLRNRPWTVNFPAKASRSWCQVAGHSWLRWGMVRKVGDGQVALPSAVSVPG